MNGCSTVLLSGELVTFQNRDDYGSRVDDIDLYSGPYTRTSRCSRVAFVSRKSVAIVISGPSKESTAGPKQQRDQYLWYLIVSEGRVGWACRNVIMEL